MRVVLNRPTCICGEMRMVGEIIEVSLEVARSLHASGIATAIQDEQDSPLERRNSSLVGSADRPGVYGG